MGVIDKLRKVVGEPEQPNFSYRCGECRSTFESTAMHPRDAVCAECGSDRVYSAL